MKFEFIEPYYLNKDNKKIGGVCAGLSEYFEVDVTLIRVLFLVSILTPVQLWILYVALWLVAPAR